MCGICGIYAKEVTEKHQQLINSIIQSQNMRGPDHHASLKINGHHDQVILGHNRLSILDLKAHANQPMWDHTKRFCIVYNGEIYNYIELREELIKLGYIFHTQGDTEVILNAFLAWGIDSLSRFHGPFAFALYDTAQNKLWLCRDRFGVKPLYYTKINNILYFASTTTVLAKNLNLKPDTSYLAKGIAYLVYEDDTPQTAYQGLYSLLPGHYLLATSDMQNQINHSIHAYYHLHENVQQLSETLAYYSHDELYQLVKNRLDNAVDIRLRTDVPLAISLSGGLDSSSVAALVTKKHHNTIGFSFSHPNKKNSEGPQVATCAQFLNMHIEYVWPNAHDMISALYKTIAVQDAPFSTLSIVAQYLLYERVRASGVKVLLGGQGGDEVFMGYRKFLLFWLKQSIKEKKYIHSAKQLVEMIPMFWSELPAWKMYWQHRHRYFSQEKSTTSILKLSKTPPLDLMNTKSRLWQRQLQDITQTSLPTLLRYEDRNSMGNSVESRLPYMDHQLVELGLALPESLKLKYGYGKWAIRNIMRDQLPESIRLARYKRGFDIPLAHLLSQGLGSSIRASLQNSRSVLTDCIEQSMDINTVFSDQQFLQRKNTMHDAITLLWIAKAIA